MRTERMGQLTVRIVGGTDGNGAGDGPVVVLMHGFGASGTDLVGLHQALDAPKGTRFVFPEAPLVLPMPMMDSRAWWMIDIARFQAAMISGEFRDLRKTEPDGMSDAREMVNEMLTVIDTTLQPSKLVLGGFSQGSMLSLDVALRGDRDFAGLLIFSGTLVSETQWAPRMAKRAGLAVFQSHGTMDPVLPYSLAKVLEESLTAAGVNVTFVSFSGMHEIGTPALIGASRFLNDVL